MGGKFHGLNIETNVEWGSSCFLQIFSIIINLIVLQCCLYITTFMENVQHMKPVQNCTGFIICTFHSVVTSAGSLSNKILSYCVLLVRITRIVFISSMAHRCIYTNIFRDPLHGIAS